MKICEAITKIDTRMHNTYSEETKVEWLSKLDWMVKKNIVDTHVGGESVLFGGYDENTEMETELLVPEPFDELYIRWLEAQIHYANGEYGKYNNAILMFNTEYQAYADYYNRKYTPMSSGVNRFLF